MRGMCVPVPGFGYSNELKLIGFDVMIYSAACAYAIRSLCQMTSINPTGNVLIDEICAGTDMPKQYVAKILQTLVQRGLVKSTKGRGGGFSVTRPASQITLFDIVTAVDGNVHLGECALGLEACDSNQPCPLHDTWAPLRDRIERALHQTTLEAMSRKVQQKLPPQDQT